MARSNGPLHLHIENSSRLGEIFEISNTRLDDALGRHPQATRDVEITIGRDGDGFREAMASAEVLFGWDFERENLVKYAPRLRWMGANLLWQKQNIMYYLRHSCDTPSFFAVIVGALTLRSGGGFQSRHDMFPGGIEAA